MKRLTRFAPIAVVLTVIFLIVGSVLASPSGTHPCESNVPGVPFITYDERVPPGPGSVDNYVLVCGEAPEVDGVPMTSLPVNENARWSHELVVEATGVHTLTTGITETQNLPFAVYKKGAPGQFVEFGGMTVTVGPDGLSLRVATYVSADGLRNIMVVEGIGFGLIGVQEYWNWDTETWETVPNWDQDYYVFSTLIPQTSDCNYAVPFEPFVWAREDGLVGVCVDPEDDFPKVNGEYLIPETNPDTPYNWISENPFTGTITVTTSGVVASGGVGRTVVATQEILQPGQGSATLLNVTAVDSVVNVLHFVVAPENGQVDEVYSVRGFGYDHGSSPNHQNWYHNASGWETSPVWVEHMIMGLEQTVWQAFMPIVMNQQPCQPTHPEPSVVYVSGQLGVCANSQPVLDSTPMSANSGPHWNYATTTGAGTHTLIINDITYPLLVDAYGDFNDGVVSVYGGTLESVTRMPMGSTQVYAINGQGWSVDLPWGQYTLQYYNPSTDSWRLAPPDEWTSMTFIRVTPHS